MLAPLRRLWRLRVLLPLLRVGLLSGLSLPLAGLSLGLAWLRVLLPLLRVGLLSGLCLPLTRLGCRLAWLRVLLSLRVGRLTWLCLPLAGLSLRLAGLWVLLPRLRILAGLTRPAPLLRGRGVRLGLS